MPITVTCPSCSTRLAAPDTAAGKKVKCPKAGCGTIVSVPAPAAPMFEVVEDDPPPPKPKPRVIPAVAEDDDDDRPRRRPRRDDDDDDDRPRSRRRRGDDDEDDYDDRPRKKKRKRSGMSPGVIAAIAIGGVVLVAALGFGIYALVGGSKAPVPDGWV